MSSSALGRQQKTAHCRKLNTTRLRLDNTHKPDITFEYWKSGLCLKEPCGAIESRVRQQLYSAMMSLQPFWRLGGLRALVTSATSQSRTFSSSHAAKGYSLDPVKRRIQMDRHNETRRLKRQADPEYLTRDRDSSRNAPCRSRKWTEEQRKSNMESVRNINNERYARDPVFRLSTFLHQSLKNHAWFRENLPWKSHLPVQYEHKVQHSCSRCVVTRHGGARVWLVL